MTQISTTRHAQDVPASGRPRKGGFRKAVLAVASIVGWLLLVWALPAHPSNPAPATRSGAVRANQRAEMGPSRNSDTQVAGAVTQAMDEILVTVLPAAEVKGETFTLGEVAEFDGFDMDSASELAKVNMGRSPNPGRPMALSEPMIRSRLAGLVQADRVRLIVPRNAQVTRAAQVVRAQDIDAIVMAQAQKDAGGDQTDLKQELLTSVSDQQFPVGALDWQVEPMGKHLMPGGDRTYQVIARVDGKEVWRMPMRVRQKVYQTIVVAARPIRRDQTISAEDVTTLRRTMNASKEAGFTGNIKSIVGMKAKRPIGQDEPINDSMVSAPAAVSEGGRVMVVYETPLLVMQVPGVAMVSGQIGTFIPVRNLQTGRIVYGVIQPDERVKVN